MRHAVRYCLILTDIARKTSSLISGARMTIAYLWGLSVVLMAEVRFPRALPPRQQRLNGLYYCHRVPERYRVFNGFC